MEPIQFDLPNIQQRLFKNLTELTVEQKRAVDSVFITFTGDSQSGTITKQQFLDFAKDLGWDGDAATAWEELVEQAKDVQGEKVKANTVTQLTRSDIESFYLSPQYNCYRVRPGVEAEIRGLIRQQFDEIDEDGSGTLSEEEVLKYAKAKGMEDAMRGVLDADWGEDGQFDFDEFMRAVLIVSRDSTVTEQEKELEENKIYTILFNPVHTTDESFLKRITRFVDNHKANEHPALERLITRGSAANLLEVLREYRCFAKGYMGILRYVIAGLPAADAKVLQDSLDVEMSGLQLGGLYYLKMLKALAKEAGKDESYATEEPLAGSPGQVFSAKMTAASEKHGVLGGLAVLLFAIEHIVPKLYAKMVEALNKRTNLKPAELVYFNFCINCDMGHATEMRNFLVKHLNVESARRSIYYGISAAMRARWEFLEEMETVMNTVTSRTSKRTGTVSELYDKQSTSWERRKPNCLSDFTGRPVVFEQLRPHVQNAAVLDIGCGEGYCARVVRKMGATKVVGIDISNEMIRSAQKAEKVEPLGSMHYFTGDATRATVVVKEHGPSMGIITEAEMGVFDVAMGVFLFNYVSIADMKRAMQDVFKLLKPTGTFVFSVPHPTLTVMGKPEGESRFHFEKGGYYSSRNVPMAGHIMTRDGKQLNVLNNHKTLGDYTKTLKDIGFQLIDIEEAAVTPELLKQDPQFFGPVQDKPLHLVFKVQKPDVSDLNRMGLGSDLQLMPAQIFWTTKQLKDPSFATVPLPVPAWKEIRDAVVLLVQTRGKTVDTYDIGEVGPMPHTLELGRKLRRMLVHETGAALTRLPIEEFEPPNGLAKDDDEFEEMSKMAYYLVCSAAGMPDESTRGRCFDVRAVKGLDIKQDNVLFSVVDTESGWHTDGASADRFVDTTALLSIRKAKTGGAFQVSNACNAFNALRTRVPAFLMYEYTRSLTRDVLEKGAGKGSGQDYLASQRKNPEMVALRIYRNNFPIYSMHQDSEDDHVHMRFRYMRFWITTGHEKAKLPMSPFLRMACDFLDKALTDMCCFDRPMEAGEVIIANNHLIAHARDAFKDDPDTIRGRHKVRVWVQLLPMEQELNNLAREEGEEEQEQ